MEGTTPYLMTTSLRTMAILALMLLATAAGRAAADPAAVQKAFERVFGDAVKLDPAMRATVVQGEPGKRHYVDQDGDGKPGEAWFIDTDLRHPEKMRPVLVRAIDEDGDLAMGGEPDRDSDLYVADWKADGTVDAVCDYTDTDGDNDIDEMALYMPGGQWGAGDDGLMTWWGCDVGDDNLLWFDVGCTYLQDLCQYRSHFGGDEMFSAFILRADDKEWLPCFENPFVFYDRDHDGVTEQVIRIEGRGPSIANLRYSFDADNDATLDSPRDFDVSISAHAPAGLTFDPRQAERRTLRGIPTGLFLSYAMTPDYSRAAPWADYMLTWDENDHNVDGAAYADTNERWEGIIAKGNEWFRQLGGPHCGAVNKRYEAATAPKTLLRVYYMPTDQRIHLYGADRLWLEVDADNDRSPEARYDYSDINADGYIDTWTLDLDRDGVPEDSWSAGQGLAMDIGYTWPEVNAIMQPLLAALPRQLFQLDARLRQALAKSGADQPDTVWQLLDSGFNVPTIPEPVRRKFLSSNETLRYYLDIVKDRLIVPLKQRHAQPEFWQKFDAARGIGDLDAMRLALEQAFALSDAIPDFDAWRAERLAALAQPRTAWAQDWVPPNIGWESDVAAYRAYWGQFDFFGKKGPCLVLSSLGGQASYHNELEWGMDTLHVNATCGIGGVTLYVKGTAYPAYSPEGKGTIAWSKKLVSQNPDQVTIEMTGANVGPADNPYTVRFQCSAIAGRKDSPIEVVVEGNAAGEPIELGIGLTKLPQEAFALDTASGVMANWGVQEPAIGAIGMGIVFPRTAYLRSVDGPAEHQVIVKAEVGKPLTYCIQGDWLRGRRFPVAPAVTNWLDELRATAARVALR